MKRILYKLRRPCKWKRPCQSRQCVKRGVYFSCQNVVDVINNKDDTLFASFMHDISDEIKAEEELIQSWNRALVGARGKE